MIQRSPFRAAIIGAHEDQNLVVFVDGVPIPYPLDVDFLNGRVEAFRPDEDLSLMPSFEEEREVISDKDRLAGFRPSRQSAGGDYFRTVYLGKVTVGTCKGDPAEMFLTGVHDLIRYNKAPTADGASLKEAPLGWRAA